MNLGDIETSIFDQLGLDATKAAPDVGRRIRRHINTVQRELLSKKGIGSKIRNVVLTCTTVANSPFLTLPQAMVALRILRNITNNQILDEAPLEYIRAANPGNNITTTTPSLYNILGFAAPVAADPAAATQLSAVSTSASDGVGTAISVEGVTSNGQYRKANISLNGLTPVNLDANATWQNLTKFYLSSPAAGDVSLKDSIGNVLGVIAAGRQNARYSRLILAPTPSTAIILTADGELHIEDMINAADEPYIPEDFHDLFELGTLMKEYRSPRDKGTQYAQVKGEYIVRTAELRTWLRRPTGVAWSSQRAARFSQLGPWFKAGT